MTSTRLGVLAVAGVVGLVALLIGWPALQGGALGERTLDGLGSWWFQWFTAWSLSEGTSLLHAAPIFHPYGKDVLQHTGANLVDAVLAVPLRALLGPTGAWNALALLIVLSNGAAAGWAMRRHGLAAALSAGSVAALNPYSLYELSEGRPTQAMLAPLILAVLWGHEQLVDPTRRGWIGLGLAVAAAGYVYWFGALFVGVALAATWALKPRTLPRLLLAGGLSLVLSLPVLIPLFADLGAGDVPGTLPVRTWWTALDLTTAEGDRMVLCTLGAMCDVGKQSTDGWVAVGPASGLVFWLLAAAAGLRDRRLWMVLVVTLLFALGPRPVDVANPFYLLGSQLPGMDRLYWPCRALALLVPLAGVGVVELVRRRAELGPLLVLALVVESGVRDRLPLGTWDPDPSAALECVRDGGVIDLPHDRDHEPLLLQTWHQQPILSGMNPRSRGQVPEAIQTLRAQDPWLQALIHAVADPRADVTGAGPPSDALHALGYRWVVVRLDSIRRSVPAPDLHLRALASRMQELAGPAVRTDDELWVHAPWGGTCP